MQKRSQNKDTFPGVIDITVGGHVPFHVKDNKIQKESMEEIGIAPHNNDLIDLGYHRYIEKWDWMDHRELQHVFLLHDNRPLNQYSFNDGEVEALVAIPWDSIDALFKGAKPSMSFVYNGKEIKETNIAQDDLHPLFFTGPMDNYLIMLFAAIDDYISNYHGLSRL